MFKTNNQPDLFTFETQILNNEQQKLLDKTPEKAFYNLIFINIKESDYKVLFSDKGSRPNAPVNILISALILKERKSWSYDELMESMMFDLRTKAALGLSSIDNKPFSRATIFNFQNRLAEHEQETGVNLLEKTFDGLTAGQLKKLKIKTDIQRTDSGLISSNIKKYSRVQLLIEVLLRLSRLFDEIDKEALSEQIRPYSEFGSQKYVYALKSSDLTHELKKLGELYYAVYQHVKNKYSGTDEFRVFERAYNEHFTIIEGAATAKPNNELNSSMLQSPDDEDATYRKKRDQESKGFTINATETANPENGIQLLTDVAVNKNNIDDSKILEERTEKIVEKTPGLKELHTDGGYGSKAVDKKMEENEINLVTTAVRGRESRIEKTITQNPDNEQEYTVECPHQEIKSTPTKKRNKAVFDTGKCSGCPLKEDCNIFKAKGIYYFTHSGYLKNKRNNNILKIPKERRKIRPNVEATIKEFKGKTKAGKLKVRGIFKTSLFAFAMGISINFGRIYRLLESQSGNFIDFLMSFDILVFQILFFVNLNSNAVHKNKKLNDFSNIGLIRA
ncbi:MAG: transposase [Bacteroidota bacterium]|nr:transposase [Bacteroidota bacterium]